MYVAIRRDRIQAAAHVLFMCFVALEVCKGQTAEVSKRAIPSGCMKGANFEHYMGGSSPYFVQSSSVENPFDFLPWVHERDEEAAADLKKLVDQKPFTYTTAITKAFDTLDAQEMLPTAGNVRVKVRVDVVTVQCHAGSPNVDLVYRVLTSQILPSMAGTTEGQREVQQTPQSASGLTQTASRSLLPSNLLPQIGFDSTDKLYAGGEVTVPLCGFQEERSECKSPIQFVVAGEGSQAMESVHTALRSAHDSHGPIIHSEYQLNYNLSSSPTGVGQIRQTTGSLEYSGTSRAFAGGKIDARFGAMLAKGDEQGQIKARVPSGDPTTSAINELKLYGGLNSRSSHNVISASAGLGLGTADIGAGIQWKKYIGDVHDQFWHSLGDSYPFELEARFTVGAIQADGPVPVAEQFFGGTLVQSFIPNDTWVIPANPVIRSIPGSRFYRTNAGTGGDSFIAGSLTAAMAVWHKPLVPDEVRKNKEFETLLEAQLNTATSIDQLHHETKDPNYILIVDDLPNLVTILGNLTAAVNTAQRAHPDAFATQFKGCTSALKMASNRANAASTAGDVNRVGRIAVLLPADEDRLNKAVDKCNGLNAALPFAESVDTGMLAAEEKKLEGFYNAINLNAAKKKADADMAFVRLTLKTLFNDVNLASFSPVAVFDMARIGPTAPGVNGTRYGPGGGLRLELASAVNFTIGYARNLKAGPGEGSGAIFFSMAVRDLFH